MSRGRILLIEDDPAIVEALREKLSMEGYDVQVTLDGEEARARLCDEPAPELVLLDLMLPRLDGISLPRWLRKRNTDLPVLIVSAKGMEEDKVAGLRAGADDYLAKPFGFKELLARVEALLRRSRGFEEPAAFGDVTVDFHRRKVFRKGKDIVLSRTELELLFYLARNSNRVVSREQILDAVWGYSSSATARTVDFHVLNLRRKLEKDPHDPSHIQTRHGLGYQIVP